MDQKNTMVAAIKAHLAKKAANSAPVEDQDDSGSMSAATEIMSAIKGGDAKALAEALESFISICQSKPQDDESSDGEESE